jgi:hypothetical protein
MRFRYRRKAVRSGDDQTTSIQCLDNEAAPALLADCDHRLAGRLSAAVLDGFTDHLSLAVLILSDIPVQHSHGRREI